MPRCKVALAAGAAVLIVAGCGSTVPINSALGGGGALGVPTGTTSPGSAPLTSTQAHDGDTGGGTGPNSSGSSPVGTNIGTNAGTGHAGIGGSNPSNTTPTAAHPTGPSTSTSTTAPALKPGPIKVGILVTSTTDTDGASAGNTVSEPNLDAALVRAINKTGGIDGHHIDPVFAVTNTSSANWAVEFQQACSTFTQDNHVDVVLGYQFIFEPNLESCLAHAGIPHLEDGFDVPDEAQLSAYPLFWSLDTPTISERSIAKLQGAINTGVLTTKDKVGIVGDSCPGTQASITNAVEPFLKAHGIAYVTPYVGACGTGDNAGAASAVNEVTDILLHFRSEGVTAIDINSVSEGPALYLGADAADSQGYFPKWIVSSLAQLSIQQNETTEAELKTVYGFGWLPSQDVETNEAPKLNASQQRCLKLMRSQGQRPTTATDDWYAFNICEAMFLYQDAVTNSGQVTGAPLSNAVAAMKNSFQSTLNLGGVSNFSSSSQNNAPEIYQPVDYFTSCRCFRYTGKTYTMPAVN